MAFKDLAEELALLGFQNTWEASLDSFEYRRSFLANEAKAYYSGPRYKALKKKLNRSYYLEVTKPAREARKRAKLARKVQIESSGADPGKTG